MLHEYARLPRAIHILCLGTFVNRAGTFVVPFLAIYIRDNLSFSMEFATGVMGAYGLGSIVGAVVGGHLADRIGRRIVMLMALVGSAAMLLVLSTTRAPALILLATCGFAAIADMYRPAVSAVIADLVEPEDRPQAYGLMYIAVNLGFAVGPVVGGLLAARSFSWLFYGDAATSLLYAVIIASCIRETLPQRRASGGASGEQQVGDHSPPSASCDPSTDLSFGEAAAHIVRDRVFVGFAAATFLMACVFMQGMSTFPLDLHARGFSPKAYGRIIAVNGILIVLLQIPVAVWVRNRDRGGALALAALVTGLGFGLQAFAGNAVQFAGCVAIWTLGEIIQSPVISPVVADLAPVPLRARYMSVLTMSYAAAHMIGAPLGGLVLSQSGPKWLWLGTLGTAVLAALLYAGPLRCHIAART